MLMAMLAAVPQVSDCFGQEVYEGMPCFTLAMSSSTATCLETVFLHFEGGHLIHHRLDQYQELVIVPAGRLGSLRKWQQPATSICQCR